MKSIELFAGIGGISLAAEWAGIETIAFCERDPFCQKVLNKHWPNVPIFDDVRTLNRKVLEEKGVLDPGGTVDVISGGFPCQPYSKAGKRKGKNDDRDLWPEMFRIIEEIRPTWVVGENVANFANMELDRTLSDLESIGYKGQSFIIPACAVNAKHRRERTFVLAYSNNSRRLHGQIEKQPTEKRIHAFSEFVSSGQNVANTNSKSRFQANQTVSTFGSERNSRDDVSWSSRTHTAGSDWWSIEPPVGRVAYGFPNRMDRLRALGNAVVPHQIYPIFAAIVNA